MRLSVHHTTTYRFDPPRQGIIQSQSLTPQSSEGQQIINWEVSTRDQDSAEAQRGASYRNGAGDAVETVTLRGAISELTVEVRGEVETTDTHGVLRGHRETVPAAAWLAPSPRTYLDDALKTLAEEAVHDIPKERALDRAHALAHAIKGAVAYTPDQTDHTTTAAQALALGHGVCQDHTHVMIACARHLDLPARYVCGYLFASEEALGTEASHAWAEVWIEDLGWVGFDASNGSCPNDYYVRLCCGADAEDAAPIRGMAQGSGAERLDVAVDVSRAEQ